MSDIRLYKIKDLLLSNKASNSPAVECLQIDLPVLLYHRDKALINYSLQKSYPNHYNTSYPQQSQCTLQFQLICMNKGLPISQGKKESRNYLQACYQTEKSKGSEYHPQYNNKDLHLQLSNITHQLWPLQQVVIMYIQGESSTRQVEV